MHFLVLSPQHPNDNISMITRYLYLCFSLLTLATFAAGTAHAQSAGKILFRKPQVEMSAGQASASPSLNSGRQAREDVEDLEEKRQTLEGEVRYAKAKLDSAQKKLSLQTAAGNVEQSDVLNQEIKDWEARLKTAKTQLSDVESEMNRVSSGLHGSDSDVIVPGENLEVFVVEDPSFNGRYQVRRGGYVILPQIGRIAVAGKTIDAAEGAVRKALQSSQLQKASVMIERISGSDIESGPLIYLSGEFKSPRPYRIPLGTSPTLISVILSSGGVTEKADLTRVKIMRMAANRGVVEDVNVQKILDGGSLSSDLTLSEGDVIIVPPGASNLIYVTGNVKRQGSYHLSQGEKLSAYGAILQSGGFSRFANEKRVHVLRAMPDGTKAQLPVDVRAIKSGKRPDVLLQSNDIIVVPEKFFSF